MRDQRNLTFTTAATYDPISMVVRYWGKDGNKDVRCEIQSKTLADYFGLGKITKDPLKAFELNQSAIEHEIRRKYITNKPEEDGSILIKNSDLQ